MIWRCSLFQWSRKQRLQVRLGLGNVRAAGEDPAAGEAMGMGVHGKVARRRPGP